MAISSKNDSNRDPHSSSSSKSKLKQKNTWEFKKQLVEKRLIDLDNIHKKNSYPVSMDKTIVRHQSEEKSTTELHSSAMQRAEEIQKNLPKQFPSFVKLMSRSHVTQGFWLGVPRQFCDDHLPMKDVTIVLIGENEKEFDTRYLAAKSGLSGGWKFFAAGHKLIEGDAVVFQLIEPCKFKVYIVRDRSLSEADGAISLLNLDSNPDPIKPLKVEEPEENADIKETTTTTSDKYPDPLVEDNNHPKKKKMKKIIRNTENSNAEMSDRIKFSESPLDFKSVKCFQDFSIHFNGLILDSEIPSHLKTKYYELCKSQNTFLHENLLQGLNSKLVAGMISETVNIADAVRACKASTAHEHLESWDRTLKAFEDLGMAVGPVRGRINELVSLYSEPRTRIIESMRNQRDEAQVVIRGLSERLSIVRSCVEKLDADIDALEAKNESLGLVFEEIASAPW
ncbi:hypothetical protein ABFX02_14G112100 [Erythranthe guttata]